MSIVHGSQGIVYFCHQFQPRFIEAGLLADEEMARAVGAINREIRSLAAVIQSPTLPNAASVSVSPPDVSADMAQLLGSHGIAIAAKTYKSTLYLFAVRMEASPARGIFELKGTPGEASVHVIGENRTILARDRRFEDDFAPHAVHLYKMDNRRVQD